jgi:hypothetical protein
VKNPFFAKTLVAAEIIFECLFSAFIPKIERFESKTIKVRKI